MREPKLKIQKVAETIKNTLKIKRFLPEDRKNNLEVNNCHLNKANTVISHTVLPHQLTFSLSVSIYPVTLMLFY